MTPSEFSELKERDVVLVLHHRHVGVMNARSCAKQMHAAFFRGERFCTGPSKGTRGDLSTVLVTHAECVPCKAGQRREPSRDLCRKSRIFIDSRCELLNNISSGATHQKLKPSRSNGLKYACRHIHSACNSMMSIYALVVTVPA